MVKKFIAIGFGALVALAPLGALTQAQAQSSTPVVNNPTAPQTGTHRSHLRRQHNMHKERARSSAHHLHQKRQAPAKTTTPAKS